MLKELPSRVADMKQGSGAQIEHGNRGLVSLAEFERQVERFVDISNRINDEWQLVRTNNGSFYMMKKCIMGPIPTSTCAGASSLSTFSKSSITTNTTDGPNLISSDSSPRVSSSSSVPSASQITEDPLQPETGMTSPFVGTNSVVSTKALDSASSPSQAIHSSENLRIDNVPLPKPLSATVPNQSDSSMSRDLECQGAFPYGPTMSQQQHLEQHISMQQPLPESANATLPFVPGETARRCFKDSALTYAGTDLSREDTETPHNISRSTVNSPQASLDSLEMEMECDSEDESCMTVISTHQTPLTYEYHVLYSDSYSVPVLYFNIFTPDGKLLPLDEVWDLCPHNYQAHIKQNKWTTLTQQEHPLLGRPYLQLHPCHTADLMTQVISGMGTEQSMNYLATWLSTVGPLIALKIAPAYIFGLK